MIWKRHFTVQRNPVKAAYLREQWRKTFAYERDACHRVDYVSAVSEQRPHTYPKEQRPTEGRRRRKFATECTQGRVAHAFTGNVHSSLEQRFRCHTCGATFTSTKGTLFYRLKTDPKIVILVLALLAYGCPLQAIVRAFELDERTVTAWQKKAGEHCQALHQHLVVNQPRDLGQVQAGEIRTKLQKRILWMALALQVSTRL